MGAATAPLVLVSVFTGGPVAQSTVRRCAKCASGHKRGATGGLEQAWDKPEAVGPGCGRGDRGMESGCTRSTVDQRTRSHVRGSSTDKLLLLQRQRLWRLLASPYCCML